MKKAITKEQADRLCKILREMMAVDWIPPHYTDAQQARELNIPVVVLLAMKQVFVGNETGFSMVQALQGLRRFVMKLLWHYSCICV